MRTAAHATPDDDAADSAASETASRSAIAAAGLVGGLIAPEAIAAAVARVGAALRPTPAPYVARRGAFLKLENLQVTGAYKVRGALNALGAQLERGDRRPVVAASAGNHGLGVAWAARRLGLEAHVVVPRGAPAIKVGGCAALGARVVVAGAPGFEACLVRARALAAAIGGRVVHAFDDPDVIAGQATVACELLPLRPDVVLVPVGGGGLAAGMASVLRPAGIRVVGVQVAGVDAMRRALAGAPPPTRAPAMPATIADGLRVAAPGELTRAICAAALDDLIVVGEDEVAAAVAELALADKLVVEGAGAVAVAALARAGGRRAVAVVSGGNIDPGRLARILRAHAQAGASARAKASSARRFTAAASSGS